MALVLTQLTQGSDATNKSAGQTYTTASVTFTAGADGLLLFSLTNSIVAPTSVTGCGLTWTLVPSAEVDWNTGASPVDGLFIFRGTGASPTTGALTMTVNDSTAAAEWKVIEITGQHTTTPVVQAATDTTDGSVTPSDVTQPTLAAFGSADNWTLLFAAADSTGVASFSWENGYVEIGTQVVGESKRIAAAYLAGNDTTPTATYGTTTRDLASIALELAPAAAGAAGQPTIRRFGQVRHAASLNPIGIRGVTIH